MNKTEFLSVRVSRDVLNQVDAAASADGLNRSEWLQNAITKSLGKRPRLPLAARVKRLEKAVGLDAKD